MNKQKFNRIINDLNEYKGVEEAFLLNPEGEVVFKSSEFPLTDEESKAILKAWKEGESSLMFQKNRFAILKNDEIQLAAKNIANGKGNIAGSITKEGDYLVIHTIENSGMILLEWSIFVNKIAWS
ncbi:MAG: hypothetical protein ACFFAN_01280 [Promethearchaeota archaeon]